MDILSKIMCICDIIAGLFIIFGGIDSVFQIIGWVLLIKGAVFVLM